MTKQRFNELLKTNQFLKDTVKITHDARKEMSALFEGMLEEYEISVYENANIELDEKEVDLLMSLKDRIENLLNTTLESEVC